MYFLLYSCTLVLLYSCTLVLLYSCTLVLLYSCPEEVRGREESVISGSEHVGSNAHTYMMTEIVLEYRDPLDLTRSSESDGRPDITDSLDS